MIIITLCVFLSSPSFPGMHLQAFITVAMEKSHGTWKIENSGKFCKNLWRKVFCFDIKLSKVCTFFCFPPMMKYIYGNSKPKKTSKTSHQIRLNFHENRTELCFVYIKDWVVRSNYTPYTRMKREKVLQSLRSNKNSCNLKKITSSEMKVFKIICTR